MATLEEKTKECFALRERARSPYTVKEWEPFGTGVLFVSYTFADAPDVEERIMFAIADRGTVDIIAVRVTVTAPYELLATISDHITVIKSTTFHPPTKLLRKAAERLVPSVKGPVLY